MCWCLYIMYKPSLCTSYKKAEVAIGKPVTASNYALAWNFMRLAGVTNQLKDYGTLFSECHSKLE